MKLELRQIGLGQVLEIVPARHRDARGFFSETYNAELFARHGIDLVFMQDNHSLSRAAGVVRGLHHQLPPHAQEKLVRVVRGRIYDVVVDIRRSSATFGQWAGLELSADLGNQILVPRGFAHGFVTLEPNTEVIYKVTCGFAPAFDRSIRYDDPDIGISWPSSGGAFQLSEKDERAPRLRDAEVFA